MTENTTNQGTATQTESQQSSQAPQAAIDQDFPLRQMIAERQSRKDAAEKGESASEKPSSEALSKNVGSAIAAALKFRIPAAKETEDETESKNAAGDQAGTSSQKSAKSDDDQGESSPAKESQSDKPKKPRKPTVDPVKIAADAAAAATKAAMSNVRDISQEKPATNDIDLDEDERITLEVVEQIEKMYPRRVGAVAQFRDNARRTRAYRDKWEAEHPGVRWDPDSEDHEEFFAGLKRAWNDNEFMRASARLETLGAQKQINEESSARINELKEQQAKTALTPIAHQMTTAALGAIIKTVSGDAGQESISKGWDNFVETDPIAAPLIAQSITELAPQIETIVMIDDPAGRVRFNPKDPAHVKWAELLSEQEAAHEGMEDDQGRTFAPRVDYLKMTATQQRKHWFLTADHLLSALVEQSAKDLQKSIDREKSRIEKAADKLGYKKSTESQATKTEKKESKPAKKAASEESEKEDDKPKSPSAGRGAEIDSKGDVTSPTGIDRALQSTAKILFAR